MTLTKKKWNKVIKMNVKQDLTLGPISTESLLNDPKHFSFTLSRYKFAAKMMEKCSHITDIGCGEGIGLLNFLNLTQAEITAIDFDSHQIEYAEQNILPRTNGRVNFLCYDVVSKPYIGKRGDGLCCMDVIEHVSPKEEERFLKNCMSCLDQKCIAVFGTPNKHAAKYASPRSKEGHINLFGPERLTSTLEKYFDYVFLFSMNDEIVHTGYNKMAHYLLALCTSQRQAVSIAAKNSLGHH